MSTSTPPLVSFCFTTFKRKEYLRQTLQSILRQTVGDYEVVVSDNDPEQSARVVVEGVGDPRFRYFPNETNMGMKKSYNKSLERSTGQFIVMIADDDPVYPEMLETLLKAKEQYPGYGVYLGGTNWYVTEPSLARLCGLKVGYNSFLADQPIGTTTAYPAGEFLKKFFSRQIFSTYLWSNAIVRRDVLIEKGGVPDYGTAFLGDYAYLSVMGSHSGVVVVNAALGHQTVHPENFGRNQNDQIKTAAINFVDYVSARVNQVENWPEVQVAMQNYVGLWVFSHLAFLRQYFRLNNLEPVGLREAEKGAFSIPYVKKYRFKYWFKVHLPALHDLIVGIKSRFRKT